MQKLNKALIITLLTALGSTTQTMDYIRQGATVLRSTLGLSKPSKVHYLSESYLKDLAATRVQVSNLDLSYLTTDSKTQSIIYQDERDVHSLHDYNLHNCNTTKITKSLMQTDRKSDRYRDAIKILNDCSTGDNHFFIIQNSSSDGGHLYKLVNSKLQPHFENQSKSPHIFQLSALRNGKIALQGAYTVSIIDEKTNNFNDDNAQTIVPEDSCQSIYDSCTTNRNDNAFVMCASVTQLTIMDPNRRTGTKIAIQFTPFEDKLISLGNNKFALSSSKEKRVRIFNNDTLETEQEIPIYAQMRDMTSNEQGELAIATKDGIDIYKRDGERPYAHFHQIACDPEKVRFSPDGRIAYSTHHNVCQPRASLEPDIVDLPTGLFLIDYHRLQQLQQNIPSIKQRSRKIRESHENFSSDETLFYDWYRTRASKNLFQTLHTQSLKKRR